VHSHVYRNNKTQAHKFPHSPSASISLSVHVRGVMSSALVSDIPYSPPLPSPHTPHLLTPCAPPTKSLHCPSPQCKRVEVSVGPRQVRWGLGANTPPHPDTTGGTVVRMMRVGVDTDCETGPGVLSGAGQRLAEWLRGRDLQAIRDGGSMEHRGESSGISSLYFPGQSCNYSSGEKKTSCAGDWGAVAERQRGERPSEAG
ncbi:hypothetical protein KUCAC02_020338, partial [Chaenocephalus aceratus]